MQQSREKPVVVITGASSGIGRATALAFAQKGSDVALIARDESSLNDVADACAFAGVRALVLPVDVTDEAAVEKAAQRVVDELGGFDVWVNDAAVSVYGRIDETPSETYKHVLDTNIHGYVHGARAAISRFRRQGHGTLINIASVVGAAAGPYQSAYVTSKHAIVGFGKSLREELRHDKRVHVCTVMPAAIDTPFFQHAANYYGKQVKPPKPVYPPERVANTIVRLASRPRREVVVGSAGGPIVALHKFLPAFAEVVFGGMMEREHFRKGPASSSDGNVFHPLAAWNDVRGGWMTSDERGQRLKKGVGALVALGVGLYVAKRLAGTEKGRELIGRAKDAHLVDRARDLAPVVRAKVKDAHLVERAKELAPVVAAKVRDSDLVHKAREAHLFDRAVAAAPMVAERIRNAHLIDRALDSKVAHRVLDKRHTMSDGDDRIAELARNLVRIGEIEARRHPSS